MNYFVITEAQGLLTPSAFTRALRARWPAAMAEEVRNPASSHALEFSVPMMHSDVTGSLNREGCAIVFVGDMRNCAEFALWCRTLVPPHEPTTFCDESMSGSIELTTATSLDDILQVFDAPPA